MTVEKRPFDIDLAMERVADAIAPFPKAAMFDLRDQGFGSVFHQLVACMISIRTLDEVSLPVSLALFQRAPTPEAVAALPYAELDGIIRASSFHEAKAAQILEIARRTVEEFGGELPADPAILTGFKGVGPKCAHLACGVAAGLPVISVDIHVHRVTNRWGYVATPTPEATLAALEKVLPKPYWIEINARLVPFGKHVCTGRAPKCSTCPVLEMCRQVGVTSHR